MLKRFYNPFNTLVLLTLALGLVHFSASRCFSADTYAVPQTAEAKLAWDPNDPSPDGYRIYQREEGQSYDYSRPSWTGSGTSGTAYNLKRGATYYFVVRAFVGAVESVDSEEVSFVAPLLEPTFYTISTAACEHGSISPAGTVVVAKGDDQAFAIIPDAACHVVDVKVDGVSIGAVSSYTFSHVTEDHTIEAVLSVDRHQIIASSGANGSITPSGTLKVDHGTSKTFVVSSSTGYHVADVRVDGISKGAITTYTFDKIENDHTIHASFEPDPAPPKTIPRAITSKEMEFGDVQADHTWTRVNFKQTYVNPVVVAGPIGPKGSDPSVIRIQNVDPDGFEIRIQVWDYLHVSPTAETVSYLVLEQGNYFLKDGTKIEAGSIMTNAAASFKQINFNDPFNVPPVVMTAVTSFNDSDALTGRMRRITVDGFQYRMQEQEANAQNHGAERLAYIAWEPSSGTVGDVTYLVENTADSVRHDDYCIFFDEPFASPPAFLADMQTCDGADTANIRFKNKDEFAVDVMIDEEQSKDTETRHTSEIVGFMAFVRNQTGIEAMEFGDVQLNHTWTRVDFEKAFANPVVVAGPIGLKGSDPSVIRIRNVDPKGFEMRLQEWDYLDGKHTTETVSYLVMEQGNYNLHDGTLIEAVNLDADAAKNFQSVGFRKGFNTTPVVMTSITSFNDPDALTVRMKEISIDGFHYRMQEQEGNAQNHGAERLAYIAWEPSSGTMGDVRYLIDRTGDSLTHNRFTIDFAKPFGATPVFLADMQTADGRDTANVRYVHKDEYGVDVLIDEEQSKDTEVAHTKEIVGFMSFVR